MGDALDAVWLVEAAGGHGTAFHMGDGEWITAAHVIGDQDGVVLRHGSDQIAASVVGIDHVTDVALLDGTSQASALTLTPDAPEVGSDVLAVGYPLYGESEPSVTRGVVSRLERDPLLGELVLTDSAVNPGNSGGPLLDACGAVVGMIVQKIVGMDVEGVGYAVTAAELGSQLPRLRDGYSTATTTVPATTVPADDLSQWTLLWTEPDLMTGATFPFAITQAVEWEMETYYAPPELWIGCSGNWTVWWGGKYLYAPPASADMPHLDDLIAVEWRVDNYEFGVHSWTLIGDEMIEAGGLVNDELHSAASQPSAMWLVIQAWNGYYQDQQLIGTAAFALDGYVQTRNDLLDAC